MVKLPVPSFTDHPLPYLVITLVAILGLCFWPFNFLPSNQVVEEPGGGLRFTPPATAYTSTPPTKLLGLPEWTIIMDVKVLPPWRQGRILSYSLDERRYNLNIEQLWDYLLIRVRLGSDRSREIQIGKFFEPSSERRFTLAMIYDGKDLAVYFDGERKALQKIGAIDYRSWSDSYPLVLGSQANGKFGWKGIFYNLIVLDRAASPSEMKAPGQLFKDATSLLYYSFTEGRSGTLLDLGAKAPALVSWPGRFIPYERTILQAPRDYWPEIGRPFLRDIFANIIIYLPIGYLLSTWLVQKDMHPLGVVIAPIIVAFSMSLTIEVLQAYLPTRNSSTVDVIMNSLGASLGVLLHRIGWAETALKKLNLGS